MIKKVLTIISAIGIYNLFTTKVIAQSTVLGITDDIQDQLAATGPSILIICFIVLLVLLAAGALIYFLRRRQENQ